MNRTDIIQTVIDKINAKKYLEIGISSSENWKKIRCENKVSVDPEILANADYVLTSDKFFEQNQETFDVVFVDGLHHADQVKADILNSLAVLTPGGYIICHDINPIKEQHQLIPFSSGTWNGDCWKAFVELRSERDDLDMYTVDTDHGCGVIVRGKSKKLKIESDLTYQNLEKNRAEWLNLISIDNFKKKIAKPALTDLLEQYIKSPNNPTTNWNLALHYDEIGQLASAVSYYIRTAERATDDLLKYECLIRAAMCFERQGTRKFTVKGMLQHAVAIQPKRPEGHYLLSKFYETEVHSDGRWLDSYLSSSIALEVCNFDDLQPLKTAIDYPGKYALMFQKAHTAWWCGLCDESKEIFLDLHNNYSMSNTFTEATYNNLTILNALPVSTTNMYSSEKLNRIKYKFNNIEKIQHNYSEAYQDMFVLTLLNGKQNGTYLEIGAGHSSEGNNTYLLETQFGWKGLAVDFNEICVDYHLRYRSNPCVLKDATTMDYEKFLTEFKFGDTIDYLQLDCDPPEVTYQVLQKIPFDKFKFAIITFEHDLYASNDPAVKNSAREYLRSNGYVLMSNNIAVDLFKPYEDWYVHPDLVDLQKFNNLIKIDTDSMTAEQYLLNE